jgi:hypothetical protein
MWDDSGRFGTKKVSLADRGQVRKQGLTLGLLKLADIAIASSA